MTSKLKRVLESWKRIKKSFLTNKEKELLYKVLLLLQKLYSESSFSRISTNQWSKTSTSTGGMFGNLFGKPEKSEENLHPKASEASEMKLTIQKYVELLEKFK